jgi:hypothetical protein
MEGFMSRKNKGTIGLAMLAIAATGGSRAEAFFLETGIYEVEMRIGDKVYQDVLILGPEGSEIVGTFTVPGAFTAPLKGVMYMPGWASSHLSFTIEADEGKGRFEVRFRGAIYPDKPNELAGEAKLADGSLLGTFTARGLMRKSSCASP